MPQKRVRGVTQRMLLNHSCSKFRVFFKGQEEKRRNEWVLFLSLEVGLGFLND